MMIALKRLQVCVVLVILFVFLQTISTFADSVDWKELKTEEYSLTIPENWELKQILENELYFVVDNRVVGNICTPLYFANSWYYDFSEIDSKIIDNTNYIKFEVENERIECGGITYDTIHYYYKFLNSMEYYDLCLCKEFIDEEKADKIAESFKLNKKVMVAKMWAYARKNNDSKILCQ